MKTKPSVVAAVVPGLLTLKSVSKKTYAATRAACNKAWLSSMAKSSACRGRVNLIPKPLRSQFLMANFFYQVTANATTQIA
jgi:hypothetical protein